MDLEIKQGWNPDRYGEITYPHKSEIVLLRGRGCFHSNCKFCDYHLDKSSDVKSNFELNKNVLDNVTGKHGELEVICSGSIQELDKDTLNYIKEVCESKGITKLSLECHYVYKNTLDKFREFFAPMEVKYRIGVESFDVDWRENQMNKNMGNDDAKTISTHFDYCNLIVGITSQTKEQIVNDIELARKYFERVCVGVFEDNATTVTKDEALIEWFKNEIAPGLRNDDKFQLLIEVSDFPLGDGCMSEVNENE